MKGFVLNFGVLLVAAVMFCACSSDEEKQDAVVAILKNSNVDYWRQIAKAIDEECQVQGVKPIISFNNENADVEGQLANVAELEKMRADYNIKGVIVAPVNMNGDHRVEQAVANFVKDDIPVVVVDTPLDEKTSPLKDIYKAYVGTDNYNAGSSLASIIGTSQAQKILIAKVESSVPSNERYAGFCNVMRQEIPTWETEDVDTPENLEAQLQSHPGVENLVFFNGSLYNSVISAAKGVNVYSFDVYESFLRKLKDSVSGSLKGVMAQNTFEMGRSSVKTIFTSVTSKTLYIPTIYITHDNIGSADVKPFLDYYNIK